MYPVKSLLLFVAACASTPRVLPDDKRCTEQVLKDFALKLGVESPTFDVEQLAGSASGRRYAEFAVTGDARSKIREVADRAAMEVEISGLETGLLVRATCR
jgi:hypothetical protein